MACKINKHNSPRLQYYLDKFGQTIGTQMFEEEKVFTKSVGATKGRVYSNIARNQLYQRIGKYNDSHNYSNTVLFEPIGESASWKIKDVVINLNPTNPERKLERQQMRSEEGKTFKDIKSEPTQLSIFDSPEDVRYQNNTDQTDEKYIASEKTIRDLAERMRTDIFQKSEVEQISPFEKMSYEEQQSFKKRIKNIADKQGYRIGVGSWDVYQQLLSDVKTQKKAADYKKNHMFLYKIINNKSANYKGVTRVSEGIIEINLAYATLDTPIHEILGHPIIRALKTGTVQNKQLYQNLLKELEYGKGKEVFDRIKKDYQYKDKQASTGEQEALNKEYGFDDFNVGQVENNTKKEFFGKNYIYKIDNNRGAWYEQVPYTLEEQQEEAIVELVSLMAAGKIQETKDTKNLLGLLKQLWLEMSNFVKSLLSKKEVNISKDLDNIQQLSEGKLIEFMKKGLIKEDCK